MESYVFEVDIFGVEVGDDGEAKERRRCDFGFYVKICGVVINSYDMYSYGVCDGDGAASTGVAKVIEGKKI